jgi:hypothetical protein
MVEEFMTPEERAKEIERLRALAQQRLDPVTQDMVDGYAAEQRIITTRDAPGVLSYGFKPRVPTRRERVARYFGRLWDALLGREG